jgi:hypothetical protein
MVRVGLLNKVLWTSHCNALVLLAAASLIGCVCAVPVLTQNICCIIPELEARWTAEHAASAFLYRTSFRVLQHTSGVQTMDLVRI